MSIGGTEGRTMPTKKFDLNIEKILEDWEPYHAVREIIANGLDEQLLTESPEIKIFKDDRGAWHIRDFGRGLQYEHLTQKENDEKTKNPNMIGKFGIGLKDALATFERRGIRVLIKSKYGDITIEKSEKHGFENVVTLHAIISTPPADPALLGTEFILRNLSDSDIEKAKTLFLKFTGERSIEDTRVGQVLGKQGDLSRIYVNGVRVAEEPNFLFSYNITSVTQAIRRALNRERSNVGRTAYSDRVKAMLLMCSGAEVAERLVEDLKNFGSGTKHDELQWMDVQEQVVKILSAKKRVVFLTPAELTSETMMVDEAKRADYEVVPIPQNLKERVQGRQDLAGATIVDLERFQVMYSESFEYKFVEPDRLTAAERDVFGLTSRVFLLIGGKPTVLKEVKISETMKTQLSSFGDAFGTWDAKSQRIVIKRTALRTVESYVGTLVHEIAHATSHAEDVSRAFELELTRLMGIVGAKAMES